MPNRPRIAMTIGAVILGCGIGLAGILLFDLMPGEPGGAIDAEDTVRGPD